MSFLSSAFRGCFENGGQDFPSFSWVFSLSVQLPLPQFDTRMWLEGGRGRKNHLSQVAKPVSAINSICSCECLDVPPTEGMGPFQHALLQDLENAFAVLYYLKQS